MIDLGEMGGMGAEGLARRDGADLGWNKADSAAVPDNANPNSCGTPQS